MSILSKRTERVSDSPIRKMVGKAAKMDNVISFALGEPDFDTPQNIISAAVDALKRGETHYSPNKGIEPLRKAIAAAYRRKGLDYDYEEEIMITSGGIEALFLGMSALLDKDDEVIISDPYWSNHIEQIKFLEGMPVLVPVYEKDGFAYDIDNLRAAVTPETKVLLLNYPANPTGGVAKQVLLEQIAELAIEKDLWVISDDVYEAFSYVGETKNITSHPGMKERTLITNSFSKIYAMTGWRVGYALGPDRLIRSMVRLQENVVSCVNTAAQYAAVEALDGPQDELNNMITKYGARREILIKGLNSIDRISCIEPLGAFYAFANIGETGLTSVEFSERLLDQECVVVVPGSGFGSAGEGFVRLSYATSEDAIREGLERIRRFVSTL